uniref:SMP-30/Gluconolactonase/LRE-like region domain-containing protein n=1 Tax=Chromera velia CCMP2878 TaxID=1169474 RepID=A0A0G4I052_9ALVE|eukprot:Cvel_9865.t1-p1 / transcript=Cvel_9865.t1 / gene=Cvel_9865 / organism=Chromera_velia_CCMP2878 / gene_product=Putative sugar lactone lactonase YvrE, putative / transcript_product=Putative sugar lactone lactonase YvrE, putative / location=Cvel_scaffold581:41875-42915(-) / protein_length=347 / sequence_SO=supercontig / SO=protein_coding / is_pseudo=false
MGSGSSVKRERLHQITNTLPSFEVDSRNEQAACMLWSERLGRLLWVDQEGRKLFLYDPEDDQQESNLTVLNLQHRPFCFGFVRHCHDTILAVALEFGVTLLDLQTFAYVPSPLAEFEPEDTSTFPNGGRTDKSGHFVVVGAAELWGMDGPCRGQTSSLHALGRDGVFKRLTDAEPWGDFRKGDGLCFAKDGITMYATDWPGRVLKRFQYDHATRSVVGPGSTFFKSTDSSRGYLTGAVTDSQHHVWVAHWGGGRVLRLSPNGECVLEVEVPEPFPSTLCFGTSALDVLYIGASSIELSSFDKRKRKNSGSVYSISMQSLGLTCKGLPEHRFFLNFELLARQKRLLVL